MAPPPTTGKWISATYQGSQADWTSAIASDGMITDPLFGTAIAEVWTGLVRDVGQGVSGDDETNVP